MTPAEQGRYWVIKFADTDVEDLVFTDEVAARKSFESHSQAWTCWLFCEDAHLTAALRAERVQALEEAAKECDTRRDNCLKVRNNPMGIFERIGWDARAELLLHLSEWLREQARRAG